MRWASRSPRGRRSVPHSRWVSRTQRGRGRGAARLGLGDDVVAGGPAAPPGPDNGEQAKDDDRHQQSPHPVDPRRLGSHRAEQAAHGASVRIWAPRWGRYGSPRSDHRAARRVVPRRRAPASLARARGLPLGRLGQRGDAPADPRATGGPRLVGLAGALARAGRPGRRRAWRGRPRLGAAGLPAAGPAPARRRVRLRGVVRGARAGHVRRAAGAAGRRRLHGGGRARLRVRAAGRRLGHQRAAGARTAARRPRVRARRRPDPRRARPRARRCCPPSPPPPPRSRSR